jgi:hypothetical protein
MLDVQVDKASLDSVLARFASTPGQVDLAIASALRKMRKRIETSVKREAAKELRLPQKALGKRFFSESIRKGDKVLKVWIGTQPLSPFDVGSVRPYGVPGKTGGVKAGRRTYRGAFLASIYTGQQKAWIRLRSRHFSPELYPTRKRPGDRGLGDAGLRGRFPVVRAAVPIDEVLKRVVDRDGDAIREEFLKVLTQELNFYTNVRGKA